MRWLCTILLGAAVASPLAAQQKGAPIIPNLIVPDVSGERISVVVDPGLRNSKALKTDALRAARVALHEGGDVSSKDLRALANAGDGLAAQRYVRVLQAAQPQATQSDLAYYSAVAVGTGRIWTLKTMIDAMHHLDPKAEPRARIRTYIKVLYPHARAGNALAIEAQVAFNGEGRLFGPLSDATRTRILEQAAQHGTGRIEFGMAMGILERTRRAETPDPDDLAQARRLLTLASTSDHLAVSTSARNLLRLMDAGQENDG